MYSRLFQLCCLFWVVISPDLLFAQQEEDGFEQVSAGEQRLFTTILSLEDFGVFYEDPELGEELEKETYDDGSALYTYEFKDEDIWLHELIWVESSAQAAVFTYEAYGEASKTYLSKGLNLEAFNDSPNSQDFNAVAAHVTTAEGQKAGVIIRFKKQNISGMLIIIGIDFSNQQVLHRFISEQLDNLNNTATMLSLWQ